MRVLPWLREYIKWTTVSTAFFSVMTLLAMAPYDLGSVATTFPPWAKPWIFGFGVPLTALSRLIAAKKKPATEPAESAKPVASTPPPELVQHYYIHIIRERSTS